MDSGWAGILGSMVGGIGTFSATWLSAHLNRKRPDPAREAAKSILRQILEVDPRAWLRIDKLSNAVGMKIEDTQNLLLEIGARGSRENPKYWGLIVNNPTVGPDGEYVEDPSFPIIRNSYEDILENPN
jgi:hypothetical protein